MEETKKQIIKTVKNIKKYLKLTQDEVGKGINIFKAVLNSKLWELAEHQAKHFDLTNQILIENNLVINSHGRVVEYDPKKHELLIQGYEHLTKGKI